MKIRGLKERLIQEVQPVCDAISPRATLPILSNILIKAFNNKVQMIGTDLEMGVLSKITADILEEGVITIPAKKFMEIIRELPEDEVMISTQKNNTLIIECKKAFFKIMGLPGDEFPELPKFDNKETITLPQALLRNMLNKTNLAVSYDETRRVLSGILFELRPDRLRLVATDGRRLALVQKDLRLQIEKEIIVPGKTINGLSRTLKDRGEARVMFAQNQVGFNLGDIIIVSRLIEGHFPNYEQAIPQGSENRARMAKDGFLQAIRRASLLTSQTSQAIKLEFFKDRVTISSRSPDLGEAREDMNVAYDGKEMAIGFNPKYLIDVLKNIDQDEVTLELIDPERPGVIREEGGGYIYVIMPMEFG